MEPLGNSSFQVDFWRSPKFVEIQRLTVESIKDMTNKPMGKVMFWCEANIELIIISKIQVINWKIMSEQRPTQESQDSVYTAV